jgi:peptidoglycan/xylan/chitin deacetylase (PgdA/CDA1 family)
MMLPLLPLTVSRVPLGLRQALGQEGVPFVDLGHAAFAVRFVLFDSRNENSPPLRPGQEAVDVDIIRRQVGRDLLDDLVDEAPARRCWAVGPLDAVEQVARVDKRSVRRRVMTILRSELERLGGVWMTVGAYPHPYRSAFNFRFDHDEFVAADFDAVLAALRGWEDAASHYVCGSTHERHTEALERLRGMDVGSHGYWHHTYRDAADNESNIGRGIDVLRAAGIEPSGFVAPHGRFNAGLLETLGRLGIGHSSEFALAYDELPFFPRQSSVLQIPVHPVSLGIILEAARREHPGFDDSPRQIQRAVTSTGDYFTSAVRAKHSAGEPVFLYCHPDGRLGRYPQVLRAILAEVGGLSGMWRTTYSRFAEWWRQRARVTPRVDAIEGGYAVAVGCPPAGFSISLEFWRGDRLAALPLHGPTTRVWPDALRYEARRPDSPLPQARSYPSGRGLRAAVRRELDWERVTPPREIRVRGVRSLMKKTLRYIKR